MKKKNQLYSTLKKKKKRLVLSKLPVFKGIWIFKEKKNGGYCRLPGGNNNKISILDTKHLEKTSL